MSIISTQDPYCRKPYHSLTTHGQTEANPNKTVVRLSEDLRACSALLFV